MLIFGLVELKKIQEDVLNMENHFSSSKTGTSRNQHKRTTPSTIEDENCRHFQCILYIFQSYFVWLPLTLHKVWESESACCLFHRLFCTRHFLDLREVLFWDLSQFELSREANWLQTRTWLVSSIDTEDETPIALVEWHWYDVRTGSSNVNEAEIIYSMCLELGKKLPTVWLESTNFTRSVVRCMEVSRHEVVRRHHEAVGIPDQQKHLPGPGGCCSESEIWRENVWLYWPN